MSLFFIRPFSLVISLFMTQELIALAADMVSICDGFQGSGALLVKRVEGCYKQFS
jgi:hypothetical protein